MSRYHFQLTNRAHCSDCGLLDFPDDEAARIEAELEGRDLLDDLDHDWSRWTIKVTDETGRQVTSVLISDLQKRI